MLDAALMAISPLDGRYQSKMKHLMPLTSEFGLMKYRVEVEIRWLITLIEALKLGSLSPADVKQLTAIYTDFTLADAERIKHIELEINHDVKAVEYFIKEKLISTASLKPYLEFIHFGCTSEDINNLAYGVMLKEVHMKVILPCITDLLTQLKKHAKQYAALPMLARTHGQPATPTTLGKEFANVYMRILRQYEKLKTILLLGKLNGATGNYNAFKVAYPKISWEKLSQQFVQSLGLNFNPYTTQIEPHDSIAEFFSTLIHLNTILIDFNRDIWGYIAINYFHQISIANEVGSSTMPHKINPIDFENAEGNLGIANALFDHMVLKLPISRFQRDLTDSTVLRNIGVAIGHSVLAYQSTLKGFAKLKPNTTTISADLAQHWEVLAEAIQTVMRAHHLPEPYEALKAFTRGKTIDEVSLHDFIKTLALPDAIKQELLNLTPSDYIGYAKELAERL